jgi:hypothetical protein
MSLANVLAVSQAAESIVLLGDPGHLEQPTQGSHPDGSISRGLGTAPDRISHPSAALTAPSGISYRRVLRCLVLHLRVDLGAD